MSDEGYIVVTAESVCAIMCHDKVVGIQAMSDKGHAVLMESVPPAGVSMAVSMQMFEKGYRVVIGDGVCATGLCQYGKVSVHADV